MIGAGHRVRVFACCKPVDMRKSFDGLAGVVEAKLRGDVTSGAMFLFVNRRRTMAKVLWVDGVGTCLFAKRLEKGRFASLWTCGSDGVLTMTRSELDLFLDGCSLIGRLDLTPRWLTHQDLVIGARS
ncbi:MAG TPA: IS66 family insertion sequence element accessory protein TnpB [Enhygromyxa sp.]|nr:IS66 family insertion sequence element accessory protein TnpB [Enhygromyxa sp.]